MGEAKDSPDPYQRARWYMYQNRDQLRVDYELDWVVLVLPIALMEMEPPQMEQRVQVQVEAPQMEQQMQ